MGKLGSVGILLSVFGALIFSVGNLQAQCTTGDIMDPGFQFLTNSRGCAPFTVQLQTTYLNSTVGTVYYIDWGDGTAIESYVQTSSSGVILEHQYPNSPVECGYDVIIDVENECNPRGSVTPIETQVIVWTNDVISINPQTFRVCEGFAQELMFSDDSDWNCFPRDTRENEEARWIQWIYGTGDPSVRITGITIDSNDPGSFPYQDTDPNYNPLYPVLTQGQTTLPIGVPATAVIGEEFEVTLKNWNQCNPYDNNVKDGDGRNPVSGDVINGDNDPMTTTARIVVVPAPEPEFQSRAGSAEGPVQSTFCIGDEIYFENLTPSISGASLAYTWEIFNNNDGSGEPVSTINDKNPVFSFNEAGTKFIRLGVKDNNAVGACENFINHQVVITPMLIAKIGVNDTAGNPITPEFCQDAEGSRTFTVRFIDESEGTVTSDMRWRWEFYDENGVLFQSEPTGSGYSTSATGPFDIDYQNVGDYQAKLILWDEVTGCVSEDEVFVKVNRDAIADFSFENVCEGDSVAFQDLSVAPEGESIIAWNYDVFNDGSIDTILSSSSEWKYLPSTSGDMSVALTVVTAKGCESTIAKTVRVKENPIAEISADVLTGCSELEVTLENLSWNQVLEVDHYIWEVNNGNGFETDSVQSPSDETLDGIYTRIFLNNGSTDIIYNVRMVALGKNGCTVRSNTLDITVTPGPVSGFLFTNYSPYNNNCSPEDISFQADSETQALNPESYTWEVSIADSIIYEENTGITPNFTHSFINNSNAVIDFGVRLTTSLGENCTSDSTIYVRINPVPRADFDIDTLSLDCENVTLRFSSLQKGLSFYKWRLEAEGTVIFSYEGASDQFDYTFDRITSDVNLLVSLITRNMTNCTSEEVLQSTVIPARNTFIAAFTIPEKDVQLPDATIQISNQTTPGNWEYLWDFGNGETSTDPDLNSYTYTEPGNYLVNLTIFDGYCEKNHSVNVSVTSPAPTADFDFVGEAGCLPYKVTFENYSTYGSAYLWDFGDGNTSTDEHPEHSYITSGIYSVRLTVYGFNGEEINHYEPDIIEVYDRPSAYFEVRPSLVYVPDMPIHTRNLSTGATNYYWDFGDGTVSTDFEPNHTYLEAGQYDITLEAYNEFCYDSLTLQGAVTAKIAGRVLIPNAFSPNTSGPGSIDSGDNDVFLPLLSDAREFTLQVFNRWGELLFEGHNEGWTGYYNGVLCAQDVYVYKLAVTFNNGEKNTTVGDVNLIR